MTPANPPKTYDALIVGGGVIGLSCALAAARRGLRVCLIERDQIAAGATGVAAGMLAPVGEATWGEENLLELALHAARSWPRFAADLAPPDGRGIGYRTEGALHVALDRDEVEELQRRHTLHQDAGLASKWLRPRRCRELEPGLSPVCAGGLFAPGEASVDPGLLVAALAGALRDAGGELIEDCGAEELLRRGGAVSGVRAGGREFEAPAVVVATGTWAGADWLPEEARPPVRPVKGEILTVQGSAGDPVCTRIVAAERFYAVPRDDGRLVIGATVEEKGFDAAVTAGGVLELLRESYRALPEIAELELVSARAGLRPGTPDNAPLIGTGAIEGLVLATGHFRNGVLLAPVTAETVAALLSGTAPPADLSAFAPDRFSGASATAVPGPEAIEKVAPR